MKQTVRALAERSYEVIDLDAPPPPRGSGRYVRKAGVVPKDTPQDLIAAAAPLAAVTVRRMIEVFEDQQAHCQMVGRYAGFDHNECLYADNLERECALEEFGVTWDPELRF